MDDLTPQEQAVVIQVLLTVQVENLIGAEEWDLSEDEEDILWRVIHKLQQPLPPR